MANLVLHAPTHTPRECDLSVQNDSLSMQNDYLSMQNERLSVQNELDLAPFCILLQNEK